MGITELSGKIALDWFNDTLTTDTGDLAKHTPLLDEVDAVETVYSCHTLYFSSSAYRSTRDKNIYDLFLNSA